MGLFGNLFSNPPCPRCGKPSSLATSWDGDYYTCYPCVSDLRQEKEEKQDLKDRITKLENQLKD